jgi:uncharacterized protein with FMN-binding domain
MRKLLVIIIIVVIANIMLVLNKYTINDEVINNNNKVKYEYKEGSFTGIGEGFVDNIEVQVIFKKDETGKIRIVEVNILKSDEVTKYWEPVKEKIINEIIERQTLDVDTVTGATESSKGLLEAIKDARKKAINRH